MSKRQIVILQRDCSATMVPQGAQILLQKGTEVTITQELGDSFTVNVYGNLARIEGKDAEALGKEAKNLLDELPLNATIDQKINTQLKSCYDPEIPVNIVDLGLVYGTKIEKQPDDQYHVFITMTLTAPGCGMGPHIAADVKAKLLKIPEVKEAEVELVFDPPWNRERMSEAAQLELGM